MMKRFMFPLFWRIFLSIWLAMAVTVVASTLPRVICWTGNARRLNARWVYRNWLAKL